MKWSEGLDLGADFASFKYIHVFRSWINYGRVVYGSVSESVLGGLDVIQAWALSVEAVRTSPLYALQMETGEMPRVYAENSS